MAVNQSVQIRRLTAYYRLRRSQTEEKSRLDSVLRDVVSDALEIALERAGVRSSEVICIRKVRVPVRLRLSRGDFGLATEWARLLAEGILLASMEPPATVRYGSRRLALIEMSLDIARGRFHYVWAWRQIGLWQGGEDYTNLADAVKELVAALCREPEAAVPVLATLGARGLLRPLAKHLEKAWPVIAAAVLNAAGVSFNVHRLGTQLPEREFEFGRGFEAGPRPQSNLASQAGDRARTICERSSILRALRDTNLAEPDAKFAALLALLECEPSLVQASTAQLVETVQFVVEMEFGPRAQRRNSSQQQSARSVQRNRGLGASSQLQPRDDSPPMSRAPLTSTQSATPTSSSPISTADVTPAQSEQPALRTEGSTRFGGLLYLLHIVDELRIPERALATPDIAARGLEWFLHRLATTLQPMASDDPAALAFCGQGPTSAHPSRQQPQPSTEEQGLIHAFTAEVQGALSELLPESGVTEKLMQFVCRRPALIVADPGWIEVRFSLQDIALEIRRVGLDIDPDYLPWLGVVVRFVYE